MNWEILVNDLTYLVGALNKLLIGFCQLLAILVIMTGLMRSLVIFVRDLLLKPQSELAFQRSRLAMGYSFSLGLSFLVGASILKTMSSNQWDDIARLISIIGVRTLLNYLLMRGINFSSSEKQDESTELEEKVTDN